MNIKTRRTLLTTLRTSLGTWPGEIGHEEWVDHQALERLHQEERRFQELLKQVRQLGELFVGMANGPFLLVLKASDADAFKAYAAEHPTHDIRITFDDEEGGHIQGRIRPLHAPDAYTLSFGIPRIIQEYVLFDENRGIRLARGIKQRFFSEITVYRREGDRDTLYRLTYNPETVRRYRALGTPR